MAVFLEVRSGSQTGTRIRLNPGQLVRIGRTKASDFAFADDSHMSGAHFTVEAADTGCHLSDLNSRNGLFLNGQRVSTSALANGDTVVAGETKFVVTVESADAAETAILAAPSKVAETPQDRLLTLLRGDFQPLFGILDAARDIRILALLLHHKEECQSLYEGEQGAKLAQVAPYLVRLQKDSPLLEALVKEGWGKNWGVYLTSPSDLQEVRHHLRHFLQVRLPSGEQVYFRFYDPRVMRVFLPTCTPEDTTQFFGPIQNYLVEDENPKKLFRFVNTGKGSERMMIALVDQDELSAEATAADGAPETETWLDGPLADEAK
jgi:pSer/pThr/pTyr-binding forkhead associated (FHA) protein